MDSASEDESIEGEAVANSSNAEWGKTKYDYYYTDYIDKDYPSKLTAKEEKLAAIEQEEALRIQKKLLSTLDQVDLQTVFEDEASQDHTEENLIEFLERQNRSIETVEGTRCDKLGKNKKVKFEGQSSGDDEQDHEEGVGGDGHEKDERRRRPISIAMKNNRGLTPYKKKEYRNPRVKHKLKYKKAMSKRRRNMKAVQIEFHRYSGEATGIKTSTVRSVKLC